MSLLPQDIIPIPSPFKPLQTKSNIHTKHGGSSLHKQNSTTHLSTPSQATDEDAPVAVKQSDDTAPPPSFINGDEPVTGMEPVFRRCTTRVERRRDREEKETGWRVFLDGDSTAVHGGDSVTLYRRVVLLEFRVLVKFGQQVSGYDQHKSTGQAQSTVESTGQSQPTRSTH
ncbi:uncharacterized protein LOC110929894 [Helianthus annuus]|uniref:uncharacterized protein LOC110929894 n=1 Tax=Helianthus annuus TaxID=4232 RepID=UPI000B9048E3|nr:uncharacterized protein LOC110929894 [Helianthus annuus]